MKAATLEPTSLTRPESVPNASTPVRLALGNVWAMAGVVILELRRRKDFYVLFVMTALITLLMGSVNFFNESGIVRYLKEICLLLIWISSIVIAVTTAARQIPAEKESRTLFPLLAKPVTRGQVVWGKFLGCWLATGICLVCFYAFLGLISGLREQAWPVAGYFQALLLHWFALAVVVALSLLGSVIFAAPSSNNTITLVVVAGILLFGRHLNKVALQLAEPTQTILYWIYYAIPHLELFDVRDLVIHNWGVIPWGIWLAALAYGAAYATIFLTLAWLRFRRLPLT